jgi:hypothetical protein
VRTFDHVIDQRDDRRAEGIGPVSDGIVRSIYGDGVLNEVVGPDAKEVHAPSQTFGEYRRRWNLIHDSYGHLGVVLQSLSSRLLLTVFNHLPGAIPDLSCVVHPRLLETDVMHQLSGDMGN